MLVIVMIGVAAAVILSTQEDLAVSGQDREALTAFYAAEYGVAQAKDWLAGKVKAQWPGGAQTFTDWGPILAQVTPAGVTQGCTTVGGVVKFPVTARMSPQDYNGLNGATGPTDVFTLGPGNVMWTYCIHNNADDVAYLDTAGNAGAPCNGATGDNCDARDALHLLTIDAWGYFPVDATKNPPQPLPGAAVSHIAVNIPPPIPKPAVPIGNCSYGVEGGCGAHSGNSGADNGNVTTGYIR